MPAPIDATSHFVTKPGMKAREDSPLARPMYSLGAAFALSVPWLVPVHAVPWTGFHADSAMAVVVASMALLALPSLRDCWQLPRISMVLACLAIVPVVQWMTGKVIFAGDAVLASAYLLAMSVAIIFGVALHSVKQDQLAMVILGSFGIASGLSLLLALNQWLQLGLWPELAVPSPAGARVTANVAQPNKLAVLFAWGLVALWWLHQQQRLRAGFAFVGALLLLFGIVMTRSRVGVLAVLLILCFALMHKDARRSPRHWLSYSGLAATFVFLTAVWTPLNVALGNSPPEGVAQRMQAGTRLLHWTLVLDAISQRPWTGWGWQQVVVAQSELAGSHPATGEVITYSHNLILDLMVWNGVPLGGAVFLSFVAWFISRWQRASSDTSRALMLSLSVLLIHAMLELPHGYATALLPAGLMMGAVEAATRPAGGATPVMLSRWVVAAMLLVLLFGLAIFVRDYLRIERAWTDERMRLARIGSVDLTALPDAPTMDHLLAALELGRTISRAGMEKSELQVIENAARRFPGAGNLLVLAQAQSLNGYNEKADRTIALICRTHSAQVCAASEEARNAFDKLGEQGKPSVLGTIAAE
jgi:O-antigen ligase